MASRESSKAQKIRNYLAANADAKAADVVKGLKAERVTVSVAQVYNVMSANRKPKGKAKGKRVDRYAALILARKMADQLGGVERAREAVDALARLL